MVFYSVLLSLDSKGLQHRLKQASTFWFQVFNFAGHCRSQLQSWWWGIHQVWGILKCYTHVRFWIYLSLQHSWRGLFSNIMTVAVTTLIYRCWIEDATHQPW